MHWLQSIDTVAGQPALRPDHARLERRRRDAMVCPRRLHRFCRGAFLRHPHPAVRADDGLCLPARQRARHQRHQTRRRPAAAVHGADGCHRAARLHHLRQHAVGARGQLVFRHDGRVPVLSQELAFHAADGAGRLLLPRLCRRALSQRRSGRGDSGRGLRRRRCHRTASRLELDREKMVPALARAIAVANQSRSKFKVQSPKSVAGW